MSTEINIRKRIDIQEEGVSITPDVSSINFTGAGVTASAVGQDVTVDITASAGSVIYYMNQSVTQSPYKEFSSTGTTAVEQVVPATVAGGATTTIASFQTASGVPNTTVIPQGLWQLFLHFNATTAGQNWIIRPYVYKRDLGGTETLIFTPDPEIVTNMSTTTTMYTCDGVFPTTTLLTTDRIVVKINMENTTGVSQTVNFRTEGSQHYSVAATTLNQAVPTGGVTSVTGTAPVVSSGGTTPAISIADAVADGTTKGAASFTASDFNSSSGNISIDYTNGQAASASNKGFLTSTDWSTFNGKVPSTRNITINGTTQDLSADRTFTISAASGVFGIANTSGVYTFYATLTLAMAAAVSGQTIEQFADVTETGAVTITLKDGVNINGNGHTYTHSYAAGNSNTINIPTTTVTCNMFNWKVIRTGRANGTTGDYVFYVVPGGFQANASVIKFTGVYMESTYGSSVNFDAQGGSYNGTLYAKAYLNAIISYNNILDGLYGESTSSGYGLSNSSNGTTNCTGKSVSGQGLYAYGNARQCVGISTSGIGLGQGSNGSGPYYNCVGISTSGAAGAASTFYNCSLISTSGVAGDGIVGSNNVLISSSNVAWYAFFSGYKITNSILVSASNSAASTRGSIIKNCVIRTDYNNAAGRAISEWTTGSTSVIVNCDLEVANSSANCIASPAGAVNMKIAGCSFDGATTPIGANITQALINTEDNQGNILL